MNKSSLLYYLGRVTQRLTLLLVIGATIIHWIILIAVTVNLEYASRLENRLDDSQGVNDLIAQVIDTQSLVVLRWAIIATGITLLLFFIKRFRKYEKAILVDSIIIILFCLVSVVFSQNIVRAFLTSL